jgi:hypothetical protein
MLSALLPQVRSCQEPLNEQAVSNALFGLQGMSSEYQEVRKMLSALLPQVQSCQEPLKAQAVGNALYGLQGMSSSLKETQELIDAVVLNYFLQLESISVQSISMGLFGLLNKNLSEPALNLVRHWFLCIEKLLVADGTSFDDIVMLYQSLALMDSPNLPLTQSLQAASLYDDFMRLKERVYDRVTLLSKSSTPKQQSRTEAYYYERVKAAYKNHKNVALSHNEFLFGFEADIVIRHYDDSTNTLTKIINIELDGPAHRYIFRKQRFCALRDEYLTRVHGVQISRYDLTSASNSASTKEQKRDGDNRVP